MSLPWAAASTMLESQVSGAQQGDVHALGVSLFHNQLCIADGGGGEDDVSALVLGGGHVGSEVRVVLGEGLLDARSCPALPRPA